MKILIHEICDFINGGAWSDKEYVEIGIPVLKVSNMQREGIDFSSINYIPFESEKKYSKHLLLKDDLVVATVGSHPNLVNSAAGRASIIPESVEGYLLNQNAVCLRTKNSDVLNQKYLAYIGKTEHFQHFIQQRGRGAANQMRIAISSIKEFEVELPIIAIQRRIASILSAYDDLIENNLKRIKLLEEIAQRTYEEWFVKFRVNGKQLIIDEKTGLPEGWRLVSVKDYSEEISKGPSLNYDNDGNKFPVINQSCIRNGEIELEKILFAQELSNNKQNCYLKINDILINSMGQGTLGRVSKNVSINERFIIHNCITFVRAKEIFSQYQLFYFLSSKQSYFEGVAQGSTGQTTLKVSLIEELEIQLAPKKIIDHFNSIIKPLWEQMGILKKQNQKLKETRDILLPKLMNGTINVES